MHSKKSDVSEIEAFMKAWGNQVCYVRSYGPMSTGIFLRPQLCSYVHRYILMSTGMFLCPQLCPYVHSYVLMSTGMFLCPQVCSYVHRYVLMSTGILLSLYPLRLPGIAVHLS